MELHYVHLDVFTDRALEGNQLAVFLDGRGIEPALMQRIAREMAFSESTFVLPPEGGGDVRMRIFTPFEELPIAGHPTIGSAFALAHAGVVAPGSARVVFELGVGPTPVDLEWEPRGAGVELSFAWMAQPRPVFGPTLEPREALAALHLDPAQAADAPVQLVSCGVPYFLVPLRSRAAVDAADPDAGALRRTFRADGAPRPVFLFTLEGAADEATAYSRMFAPDLGVPEDPATGSASGPLGCYLVRHGLIDAARARHFVSLQGVRMGRPSRIHVSIASDGGEITGVRVGGRAMIVGEGTLRI
ncbi:MAG TPA: PhzF family phenazine biosynthesis protein [Vicinamibacterales bacterium]|jgi:trans-2,3-dihydro-3-hydroxyanthranilate isomerase|nr:PhzF family phenazine biosynthesis protein [Vicinamibacterales bacterium]